MPPLPAVNQNVGFRSAAFATVWKFYGEQKCDSALREFKEELLFKAPLSGSLLDVGTGGGIQLSYYASACPEVGIIVCVEPNTSFRPTLERRAREALELRKSIQGAQQLEIEIFYGSLEDFISSRPIENSGWFDTVACFLVLCSVPEPRDALRAIHDKCLKPGGKLMYMEHVAPRDPAFRSLLGIAQPVWDLIGDGCQLCRPTVETLREAANWESLDAQVKAAPLLPLPIPWAYGVATKRNG